MFEREYRDLAHVPRWAILPTTRTQTVAEHSYFVSLYTSQICLLAMGLGYITAVDLGRIVNYALVHDRDEAYMSDIPGPVKRNIKDPEKLESYIHHMDSKIFATKPIPRGVDKLIVKAADLMDEVAFLWGESQMGNRDAERLIPEVELRLHHAIDNLPWFTGEEKAQIQGTYLENSRRPKTFPENNDDVAS